MTLHSKNKNRNLFLFRLQIFHIILTCFSHLSIGTPTLLYSICSKLHLVCHAWIIPCVVPICVCFWSFLFLSILVDIFDMPKNDAAWFKNTCLEKLSSCRLFNVIWQLLSNYSGMEFDNSVSMAKCTMPPAKDCFWTVWKQKSWKLGDNQFISASTKWRTFNNQK